MKLVKRTSIITVFLLGVLSVFTLHPLAEDPSNQNNDGKIRIEVERIGQEDKETQDLKETELEKTLPDLFKEQTQAVIKQKQDETNKSMEQLQQTIFEAPIKADRTTAELKTALFSDDNMLKYADASKQNKEPKNEEGINSKTMAALFGSVLLVSGTILVRMRQMFS
ncbi:type VII secretion protein EssA [Neobacillus mesonae]|uniref:type VII secretion protein EssA n=1 Tax=Neobacillus mesonae TaxID=1193713 RepID=UPI0025728636|nr:type VII secretion protein EssA [Neobacillus mesonae]